MTFEFLKWRPSFKEHKRGVKKGELTYERPRPYFDLRKKMEWAKFFFLLIGGGIIAWICGIIAYFVISGFAGGSVLTLEFWAWAFAITWVVFCFLHLIHSLRFIKIADLVDVDFVPLEKVKRIGERLVTMPADLTPTDYYILFCRWVWAGIKGEPYHDVTELAERINAAQTEGEPVITGRRGFAESIGKSISAAIGLKYSESRLKEIEEMAGGIPEPRKIVRILQTKIVPHVRELLGEKLMTLYLSFLSTQPPILPYDDTISRGEMRRIASASHTKEVIGYLRKFIPKMKFL